MLGTSERLVGFSLEKLKAILQFMPLWRRGWNHQTIKSKFASSIPVRYPYLAPLLFFSPFFFLHGRWCPLYVPFFCNTPPTCDHHLQLGLCFLVLVWKNCLGFSVGYQRAPGTSEKKKARTSERFVANCEVGPSTRGQGDSASLVQRR